MDTLNAEKLERRISDLETYVLALERPIDKLKSEERVIIEHTHCLIQFFAKVSSVTKSAKRTLQKKYQDYMLLTLVC